MGDGDEDLLLYDGGEEIKEGEVGSESTVDDSRNKTRSSILLVANEGKTRRRL